MKLCALILILSSSVCMAQGPMLMATTLIVCQGRSGKANLRLPDGKVLSVPVPAYPHTAIQHHWEGSGIVYWSPSGASSPGGEPRDAAFSSMVAGALRKATFPSGVDRVAVPYVFTFKRCDELQK